MMNADDPARDPARRQRLLEGWLPLANEANRLYGWGLDSAALEALIVQAAPVLLRARSAMEARAMLWSNYSRQERERL
jgi:hypothetical protein